MQISRIKINDFEAEQIINIIYQKLDYQDNLLYTKGQKISFDFSKVNPGVEFLECEAFILIYQEGYTEDGTNADIITFRIVEKFELTIFYDGMGVKINSPIDIEESLKNKIEIL